MIRIFHQIENVLPPWNCGYSAGRCFIGWFIATNSFLLHCGRACTRFRQPRGGKSCKNMSSRMQIFVTQGEYYAKMLQFHQIPSHKFDYSLIGHAPDFDNMVYRSNWFSTFGYLCFFPTKMFDNFIKRPTRSVL